MPPLVFPVSRELNQLEPPCARPLPGNSINSARIAFDHGIEVMLHVKPIQLGMDEIGIIKIAAAADQNFQAGLLASNLACAL